MTLIHRNRAATALPEMAGPLLPRMDVASVPSVNAGETAAQRARFRRHEDQVNVVGHQHPWPDRDTGPGGALGQQVAVELVVGIINKVWARPLPRWVMWWVMPANTARAMRAIRVMVTGQAPVNLVDRHRNSTVIAMSVAHYSLFFLPFSILTAQ